MVVYFNCLKNLRKIPHTLKTEGEKKTKQNKKNNIRMSAIEEFIDQVVSVITCEGRHLVGVLKGYDQTLNVILEEAYEREYSLDDAVQQIPYGLYIIRGDNIVTVGLMDEAIDSTINLADVRAEPIRPVVH